MAAIEYKMNNLHIIVSGVNGYMEVCTYTNLDPVTYIFKAESIRTGHILLYHFLPNVTESTPAEGFRRLKTDEVQVTFLGATMPGV